MVVASPRTSDSVGAGFTTDEGYVTPPPSVGQGATRKNPAATRDSRSYADHNGSSSDDGSGGSGIRKRRSRRGPTLIPTLDSRADGDCSQSAEVGETSLDAGTKRGGGRWKWTSTAATRVPGKFALANGGGSCDGEANPPLAKHRQQPTVVAEPDTLAQDSGESTRRNPDGLDSTHSGEGRTTVEDSALGRPAATTTAVTSSTTPWSWKMLATRNSTASTSAASINSAAPGPSSSDTTVAGSSGGGDGGGGRADPATAAKESEPRQSVIQTAAAPSTTVGRGARPSSVKQAAVAAAAGTTGTGRANVHVGYQKMRISSGGGHSATTGVAEADTDEALSRRPPAPSTSTPRHRGTVLNPAVGGTRESSKRGVNGPRNPMPPPSPGGSSDGVAAPPLSAEGRVTPRQPQATATTPSGNGPNGNGAVVEVPLAEGELTAGDWKPLDSAGGGSFEIETRHKTTTTPNIATEKVETRAGEEPEEQSSRTSDGLDSGFEATAVAGKSVGGMTEREIIAAAEAAVASAKKAAAGTVDRAMAPGTPAEFPVDTAELLFDAAATTPETEGKAVANGVDKMGKAQSGGAAAATGGTRRQRDENESLSVTGEDGGSVSRTVSIVASNSRNISWKHEFHRYRAVDLFTIIQERTP